MSVGDIPGLRWLIDLVRSMFERWGVNSIFLDSIDIILFFVMILTLSLLMAWLLKFLLNRLFLRVSRHKKRVLLRLAVQHNLLKYIIYILPALILLALLPFIATSYPKIFIVTKQICQIYLAIVISIFLSSFLNILWLMFDERGATKSAQSHGVLQSIQALIVIVSVIISLSILLNKSPMNLITGLGAFAAVLMLVFKDSILGFAAGIQLSQNDVIRKGDWITSSNNMINGVVVDITLNTVKVRNFDNTIVTVPPYSLISEPVQNWRAMQESGGRRICISILVEVDSILPIEESRLKEWERIELLKNFIDIKIGERQRGAVVNTNNPDGAVNGTIDTNLGLFRAYMQLYINSLATVNGKFLNMVRILPATDVGLPVEIYCFTTFTEWKSYESVKSEITEHAYCAMRMFGVRPYQNASAFHYTSAAYITANKTIPDDTL